VFLPHALGLFNQSTSSRGGAQRRLEAWIAPHPKSGLPDFGTKIAEIGNSRFRCLLPFFETPASKSAVADFDTF